MQAAEEAATQLSTCDRRFCSGSMAAEGVPGKNFASPKMTIGIQIGVSIIKIFGSLAGRLLKKVRHAREKNDERTCRQSCLISSSTVAAMPSSYFSVTNEVEMSTIDCHLTLLS